MIKKAGFISSESRFLYVKEAPPKEGRRRKGRGSKTILPLHHSPAIDKYNKDNVIICANLLHMHGHGWIGDHPMTLDSQTELGQTISIGMTLSVLSHC